MAVMRINKTADYTVMSNSHFKEKNMSLKAKGLLSLMLSLPDGWDYSIAGLVTLSKDGKDSVMGALNELEEFKYLKRTRLTKDNGQFDGYDYDIYEKPYTEEPKTEKPQAEIPHEETPYAENPNTGKPQQLNTNPLSPKELNPNELSTKEKKESKQGSFDAILAAYTDDFETLDLLKEWLKVRKAKRAAMTDRAIQMNVGKLDNLANASGMTVKEYLSEVICRGWAAFYEIKQYSTSSNAPAKKTSTGGNVFLELAKEQGIY